MSNKEPEAPCCGYMHIHEQQAAAAQRALPADEQLMDLADLFKLFGDTTRVKILYLLLQRELCVCDIAALLGMTQSAISHQLQTLKAHKLVKYRRESKTVFYTLADDHVYSILKQGMEHLNE